MNPLTIILMGPQGSGKGTQAELLRKVIVEDEKQLLVHFEAGKALRTFMSGEGFTQKRVAESIAKGERQQQFLPVYLWSQTFIDRLADREHVLIDGSPRTILEAEVLDTAMNFYMRDKVFVLSFELDEEKAIYRLEKRGRHDDTREGIKERLRWYRDEVAPVVDFYQGQDRYAVVAINGNQSVEEVHGDILSALSLSNHNP